MSAEAPPQPSRTQAPRRSLLHHPMGLYYMLLGATLALLRLQLGALGLELLDELGSVGLVIGAAKQVHGRCRQK